MMDIMMNIIIKIFFFIVFMFLIAIMIEENRKRSLFLWSGAFLTFGIACGINSKFFGGDKNFILTKLCIILSFLTTILWFCMPYLQKKEETKEKKAFIKENQELVIKIKELDLKIEMISKSKISSNYEEKQQLELYLEVKKKKLIYQILYINPSIYSIIEDEKTTCLEKILEELKKESKKKKEKDIDIKIEKILKSV